MNECEPANLTRTPYVSSSVEMSDARANDAVSRDRVDVRSKSKANKNDNAVCPTVDV